jgi:hypothetical protein
MNSPGLDLNQAKSGITGRLTFFNPNSGALDGAISRMQSKITDKINQLEEKTSIQGKLSTDAQALELFAAIKADTLTDTQIATRIQNYERRTKASCVNNYITSNFGSAQSLLQRFRNPNVSKAKSEDADNSLANSITSDLARLGQMDLAEFQNKVEAAESEGMNSRKILTLGKTFKFEGRTITASTPLKPSQLFGIFVKNCTDRYEKLATESGYSQGDMMSTLKNYASQRRQLKSQVSGQILSDVKRDLLHCPEVKSVGKAPASCSQDVLDTSKSNFCYRTAQRCTDNAKACSNTIKNEITRIEGVQKQAIAAYKDQVKAASTQLMAEVSAIQNYMLTEARRLDALLNVGTLTPLPELRIDLSGTDLTRKDVSSRLSLEDPKAYLEQALAQMTEIERAMKTQREELVGRDGTGDDPSNPNLASKGRLGSFAQQYAQNYQEAIGEYQSLIQDCQRRIGQAQEQEGQKREQIAEQNRQIADACSALQAFNADPFSAEVGEVASDAAKAVQIAAAMAPSTGRYVNPTADMRVINQIRGLNKTCSEDAEKQGRRRGGITTQKLCDVVNAGSRPDGVANQDQEIWDFFVGQENTKNEEISALCAFAGSGSNRDLASSVLQCDGTENSYIKEGYKVCRLRFLDSETGLNDGASLDITNSSNEISVLRSNSTITELRETGVIVKSSKNCDQSITLETNGTALANEQVTFKEELNITESMAMQLFADIGRQSNEVFTCNPNSNGNRRNNRREAKEELDHMIAAFTCINSTRTVGQRGLTICGGPMNGYADKGSMINILNQASSALGSAMAVGP